MESLRRFIYQHKATSFKVSKKSWYSRESVTPMISNCVLMELTCCWVLCMYKYTYSKWYTMIKVRVSISHILY